MHISLRSHLTAGTAAAVAVGAIAVVPAPATSLSLPTLDAPSLAAVALAALDSPLAQLFATANLANNYLADPVSNPNQESSWPYAGFGTTFGVPPVNYPLLPAALSQAALGGYSSVGLIPQIIDDALPILSQLGYNGSDYLDVTGQAVFGAAGTLIQGVWGTVGNLVMFNIPGALATLAGAVTGAGTLLLDAGTYVLSNVIAKAQAVLAAVVGTLPTLIGATLAQAQAVAAASIAVIGDTVAALGAGDFEGAWNSAVNGLFGPSGIPGTVLNLTIGAGVQTGPIATPDSAGVEAVFAPSIRTEIQAGVKAIAAALQTTPMAGAARAGSAASARSAAVEAPRAAANPADDSGPAEAGGSPDAEEKPAKQRAVRGAAKRG